MPEDVKPQKNPNEEEDEEVKAAKRLKKRKKLMRKSSSRAKEFDFSRFKANMKKSG